MARVSSLDGAGMDGGFGSIGVFGGGEFKMEICAKAISGTRAKEGSN